MGNGKIGGIGRKSKKCFILPVESRNAVTIERIISKNVLPMKIIVTDNDVHIMLNLEH